MNRILTPFTLVVLSVGLLASGGCSDDDGGGSTSTNAGGDDSQTGQAQTSSVAAQGVDLAGEAVDEAITTTGGAAITQFHRRVASPLALMGSAPGTVATNTDIDFETLVDVDVIIDLDATDGEGADRFPNATGLLRVVGTVEVAAGSDRSGGSASYDDLVVSAQTPVIVTDPRNGNTASWPTGTSMGFTCQLDWERTDQANWSYSIERTATAVDKEVTVTTGFFGTVVGIVDAEWHTLKTHSHTAGVHSETCAVDGFREVLWTNSDGDTLTVRWDVVSLDEIYLTLNGFKLGPFTVEQVDRRWRTRATRVN